MNIPEADGAVNKRAERAPSAPGSTPVRSAQRAAAAVARAPPRSRRLAAQEGRYIELILLNRIGPRDFAPLQIKGLMRASPGIFGDRIGTPRLR
jgi:hypothetical protein